MKQRFYSSKAIFRSVVWNAGAGMTRCLFLGVEQAGGTCAAVCMLPVTVE